MAHPFTKLFERALKKSSESDNYVLKEAQKLFEKGYPRDEVCDVLEKLAQGLIDDRESAIVHDALGALRGEDDEDDDDG